MKNILLVFVALTITATADADVESEQAALSKLVKEIDFMILKINEIREDAPTQTRIKFNYSALSTDLENIRAGITDHIKGTLSTGRVIQPIKHQYR